jgi:hypothetical protein
VRVAELENKIKKQRDSDQFAVQKSSGYLFEQSLKIDNLGGSQSNRWHLEGTWTADSHMGQVQYYGPSSSFHFINEIRTQLKYVLQREHIEFSSLPCTASKIFPSPTSVRRRDDPIQSSNLGEEHIVGGDLTRPQEEYFLNMFWQRFQCCMAKQNTTWTARIVVLAADGFIIGANCCYRVNERGHHFLACSATFTLLSTSGMLPSSTWRMKLSQLLYERLMHFAFTRNLIIISQKLKGTSHSGSGGLSSAWIRRRVLVLGGPSQSIYQM